MVEHGGDKGLVFHSERIAVKFRRMSVHKFFSSDMAADFLFPKVNAPSYSVKTVA